jgi:small subunit ribosomal protein S6
LSEEQILNFSQKLAQVVVDQNGEIDVTEMWGKRTLAYPIKRFFEGHYVLQRFYLSPQGTIELERLLRFSEDVIRYLMIRTDE